MNLYRTLFARVFFAFGMMVIAVIASSHLSLSHAQSVLGLRLTPTISVTGPVGTWQQIQYSDDLSNPTNWTTLTHLLLLQSPTVYTDTSSNAPRRFYRSLALTNFLDTDLVWIPAGLFVIGSPVDEVGRSTNENQTVVTLTQGFFMGKFEVTQARYLSVLGAYPILGTNADGSYKGSVSNNFPIGYVYWDEAANYCVQLTLQSLAASRIPPGWAYRLPSEAEWEYACRAGSTTVFNLGNALYNDTVQGSLANFDGTNPYPPHSDLVGIKLEGPTTVGSYPPNAFGLYDMHGNAAEYCLDSPAGTTLPPYAGGSVTNPLVTDGSIHVVRGGFYSSPGSDCRSARRALTSVSFPALLNGFRVVLAPGGP